MYIADFFQFKSAFQGEREHQAAPKEEAASKGGKDAAAKAAESKAAKSAPKAATGPRSSKDQAERINKLLESFDKGETEIPHAYVNLTRKMPYQTLRAAVDGCIEVGMPVVAAVSRSTLGRSPQPISR